MISKSEEYAQSMRAMASVSGGGWGVKAKAESSFSASNSFTSNENLFVLHKHSRFGFEGWEFAPPMTDYPKSLIAKCDDSFANTYGTYYIAG